MRKFFRFQTICLLLCLNIAGLLADDAPMALLPGGNVQPINNNDVQLLSETIDITMFPTRYAVEVNYQFVNHGKEQTVIMGFPSTREVKVNDLKIEANGRVLQTETRPGIWNFEIKSRFVGADMTSLQTLDAFECFEITFREGDTIFIKDSFKQDYVSGVGRESFYYVLKTGSLWKDKINSIEIRVHTENAPDEFDLAHGTFNEGILSLKDFVHVYKDIEPENDLFFTVDIFRDFDISSISSELKPGSKNNYYARNVKDKNKSTAWVEGVEGYGIGESISFVTNTGYNYGTLLRLDSIGIINGYAKSAASFSENSRVKKLIVKATREWAFDYEEGEEPLIFTFTLKDTPEIQYLKFKPPANATEIQMKIADIYKGSKYKDTAISEISFFVVEE